MQFQTSSGMEVRSGSTSKVHGAEAQAQIQETERPNHCRREEQEKDRWEAPGGSGTHPTTQTENRSIRKRVHSEASVAVSCARLQRWP